MEAHPQPPEATVRCKRTVLLLGGTTTTLCSCHLSLKTTILCFPVGMHYTLPQIFPSQNPPVNWTCRFPLQIFVET